MSSSIEQQLFIEGRFKVLEQMVVAVIKKLSEEDKGAVIGKLKEIESMRPAREGNDVDVVTLGIRASAYNMLAELKQHL